MPPQTHLTQTSIIQPQLTQEQYPYAKQVVQHWKLIFKDCHTNGMCRHASSAKGSSVILTLACLLWAGGAALP